MQRFWARFWQDPQGQDLVEYALAAGMIAVVAVASMPPLAAVTSNVFSRIESIVNSAVS